MEDREKLHQALFKSYVLAYPSKSKRTYQDELNSKWNEIRKTDNFPMRAEQLMTELTTTATTNKGSLMKFWSKQASSGSLGKNNPPVLQIQVANDKSLISKESVKEDDSLPSSDVVS